MAVERGPALGYGDAMRDEGPRESVVREQLMALHSQVDRLEHQSSRLRGHLEPVLRMTPEQENKILADVSPGSEVTREIRRANERVAVIVELLISTIDQLDV